MARRQLLGSLVFKKLEEEQLLLTAGKVRWVNTRLAGGRDRPGATAGHRTAAGSQGGAAEWLQPRYPVPACVPCRRRRPGYWSSIFGRHRQAFLELTGEIRDLSERNRHLLAKGRDAAREALNWLTGNGAPPPQAYTSSGGPSQVPVGHLLVNKPSEVRSI